MGWQSATGVSATCHRKLSQIPCFWFWVPSSPPFLHDTYARCFAVRLTRTRVYAYYRGWQLGYLPALVSFRWNNTTPSDNDISTSRIHDWPGRTSSLCATGRYSFIGNKFYFYPPGFGRRKGCKVFPASGGQWTADEIKTTVAKKEHSEECSFIFSKWLN